MPEPRFYHITFSELGDEEIHVLSFKGEEHLTRPFLYEIELLSPNRELDMTQILNKQATLKIEREGSDPHEIHGIITCFKQRGQEPMTSYYVELVPRIWLLGLARQSAVYQYMTLQDLITQILEQRDATGEGYGIEIPLRFEMDNNPELEFVGQHNETNLNFLHRRLEHFGVSYFIDHSDGQDTVVFTDRNEAYPAVDYDGALRYRSSSAAIADPDPTITNWVYEERVRTGMFKMKDYNPEIPSTPLEVESQLNAEAPGVNYEYGDNFVDQDGGQALVRIRNEEILCQQKEITATTDMRAFFAGCTFELDQHYRGEWNQPYLITSMKCEGSQWGAFGHLENDAEGQPYISTFTAIPADVVYRPARTTPIPRIPGIMSAIVESSQEDDEYAFIDDAGRYKVRLLYDMLERDNTGDSSLAVRQVQPYSGNDYGIHFPNHAGTEMIVAFADGDPDRPIGLGTVPHQEMPSPVHAEKKTKSTIRTAGQNELTFDDDAGNELIFLNGTKDWNTTIANDSALSVGNDETAEIGNNQTLSVGSNQDVNIGSNQTLSVGANRDKTVGGSQTEAVSGSKTITVAGNHGETISGSMNQTIAIAKTENVGAAKALSIGAAYQVSVGAAMNQTIGAAKAEEVGLASTEAVGYG